MRGEERRWLLRIGAFAIHLLTLFCISPSAFAEYKTLEIESLRITFDSEWPPQGSPGYLPVRFDITNLEEAREIEIIVSGQRFFGTYGGVTRGGTYRSPYTGNADVRQTVRLKRGDRVQLTLSLPVFADQESFQFSLRENGRRIEGFSAHASFQSGRPITESPVLLVANPTTLLGTMASSWRRPVVSSRPVYYSPTASAPSGAVMDFTLEPERLPTNWLGFTSLRAVLIGPAEWKQLTPAQQDALLTWTASGGDLLLVDGIPEAGFPIAADAFSSSPSLMVRPYFFGHVHALKSADITSNGFIRTVNEVGNAITSPDWALPANRARDWGWIQERGFRLPIEGAGIVSARVYLSILVLFIALIGPVNYIYLWRKRLPVLMVFTVPLVSACFILLLTAYGLLIQGFDVRARAITFTMLDQNLKQAATRSSVSLYPGGITPGEGVRFPSDLAVFPLGVDGSGITRMSLDLTSEQRFTAGLLQPRAPSNFEEAGFRAARERLSFERDGDNLSVINGLGSTIQELYYRENSRIYGLTGALAPGEKALMKVASLKGSDLYAKHLKNTPMHPERFSKVVEGQRNGTYLAVLETSPFWSPGVAKAEERNSFHLVLGFGGVQP